MVRKDNVFQMLQGFGIQDNDKVTIHCSLRAIGEIEGGAVVYGQLGNALVYCCDARKMTDIARDIWKNRGDELLQQEEW